MVFPFCNTRPNCVSSKPYAQENKHLRCRCSTIMWSPKGHAYLVGARIVSVILIFVFALSSSSPAPSASISELAREINNSPDSQSITYHNTLLVDYLQPEDFQETVGYQQSETKATLIQSERVWQKSYEARKNISEDERKSMKPWERTRHSNNAFSWPQFP